MKSFNSSKYVNLIFLLMFIFIFITIPKNFSYFSDADPFWHVELGKYMLKNHSLIHTAIHTFGSSNVPYVPHEVGYQILASFLYNIGGWHLVFLIPYISLFFLVWGFYSMSTISRKENGLKGDNSFLFVFSLMYSWFYCSTNFTLKPFVISVTIIVWIFIWLRKYQLNEDKFAFLILPLLSLLLSNFHGGVWAISFAFVGMFFLETTFKKKLSFKTIVLTGLFVLGGILNSGGIKTLLYSNIVGDFKYQLVSFAPTNFSKEPFVFVLLLTYLAIIWFSNKKQIFHYLLISGVLYLFLSAPYARIYSMLFIPYFFATFSENFKSFVKFDEDIQFTKKFRFTLITLSILVSFIASLFFKIEISNKIFPKEEMSFILKNYKGKDRPDVLADYVPSGYIVSHGGNVLSDPRLDPFIDSKTKGIYGWTSFERQNNAFYLYGSFLNDIIEYDHPDYLIIRKQSLKTHSPLAVNLNRELKKLGKPDFTGSFGYVWIIKK